MRGFALNRRKSFISGYCRECTCRIANYKKKLLSKMIDCGTRKYYYISTSPSQDPRISLLLSPSSVMNISATPSTVPGAPHTWPVSTYSLVQTARAAAAIHIDHPNAMGTTAENGLPVEQARLSRFRSTYISRELHDAAVGRSRGLSAALFRRSAGPDFLARCTAKTCFRREDLNIDPPASRTPVAIDNGAEHAVQLSEQTFANATETYGAPLMADVQLGFSRPFSLQELRTSSVLPFVDDSLPPEDSPSHSDPESVLSLVVSYRHTTAKDGHLLNIPPNEWPAVCATAAAVAEEASRNSVRFWTDQILSRRKPSAALRWVSSGVLPYAIYPVLFVQQRDTDLFADLDRMWISVEHLMASFGHGLIHSGPPREEDEIPHEWPTTYIRLADNVSPTTWAFGMGGGLQTSVRKLCAAIMCGLTRNKAMSWASDAQDLLDWASTITSALLFRDIGHTFDCSDCQEPLGYTSGQRLMTLLSSGVAVVPGHPDVLFNGMHPRLDVPAVKFSYCGRGWDGFREWVPESCLWGIAADENKATRAVVADRTRAIVTSRGGSRAIAVLQFCMEASTSGALITAHMLVGLTEMRRDGRVAQVVWTKRFWPVDPLRMWTAFQAVWDGGQGARELQDFGTLVGASSMIDYTDIIECTKVIVLGMKQARWN